jgi:hypothetical protein
MFNFFTYVYSLVENIFVLFYFNTIIIIAAATSTTTATATATTRNPMIPPLNQPSIQQQQQPYHPSSSGYPNSYVQEHQGIPPRSQFPQQQQQQQNIPAIPPQQISLQHPNQLNNIHAAQQNPTAGR